MPYMEKGVTEKLSPLDKALNDIRSNKPADEEAPAEKSGKKKKVTAKTEEPKAEEKKAEPVPPVPVSRIVEVQPNTSFFGLSVGMYDPFTHDDRAASFNFEFQPGVKIAGALQPIFGAFMTTRGAMMGYGGLGLPFKVADHVMMMPSVAVGAYDKGDNGFDLGQTLALRIGTELAYEFDDKSRFGLSFHVLSNGSFSQANRTEMLGLTYTVPLETLRKKSPVPAKQANASQ